MSGRVRLLNPGPVTLTERVRGALQQPDLCHREQEFADLQLDVRQRLEAIYDGADGYVAVMLTGSGTAAVEAMVGSVVPRDGHALVVANGVYGDRMAQMLAAQGKRHDVVAADWLKGMDLAAVDARLAADASITHVLAVHHETTTGRLNDLDALGAICKRHNRPLLLDGVSSFGGEPIRFAEWNLDAVAATANKCLHGVPGISFVLVKKSLFTAHPSGATSVYLDLWRHWKEQERGWSPFTQSVHVVYALQEALRELDSQGGWKARHAEYARRAAVVRNALAAMKVEYFLDDGATASSSILTAFKVPAGKSYDRLHDDLKARGFVIYAGQGPYLGKMFRIAVMGDLGARDLEELVEGLKANLGS
ncbi:MAG: 2-aminoethylphosphonate--pyruvate transaminase [Polyangiales bacterium]